MATPQDEFLIIGQQNPDHLADRCRDEWLAALHYTCTTIQGSGRSGNLLRLQQAQSEQAAAELRAQFGPLKE